MVLIDAAVHVVKKGAFDFIAKPPDLNRLLITIRNAIDRNSLIVETKQLRKKVKRINQSDMIGSSVALVKIKEEIEKAIFHIERNGNAKIIFTDVSIRLTRLIHRKENL